MGAVGSVLEKGEPWLDKRSPEIGESISKAPEHFRLVEKDRLRR